MSTVEAPVASIRTGTCDAACRQAPWVRHYFQGTLVRLSQGLHERGDVRRCEHGTIWFCEGRYSRNGYMVSGYWTPLHPVWNLVRYYRATQVLA